MYAVMEKYLKRLEHHLTAVAQLHTIIISKYAVLENSMTRPKTAEHIVLDTLEHIIMMKNNAVMERL